MTNDASRLQTVIFPSLVLTFLAFLLSTVAGCESAPSRQSGPLSQEAYVWQRSWDDPVNEAISTAATEMKGLVVLAAEISFEGEQISTARVGVDYESLKQSGLPIGLALRIGAWTGEFSEDAPPFIDIGNLAKELLAEASGAGLEVDEFQLDFDCASSDLDGYRHWVAELKKWIAPVPLVITCLPTWLNERGFRDLASSADSYVLQVHSLERPESIDSQFTICDTAKALAYIETASRFNIPFRVALPTYSYVLAFDSDGKFSGLSAERPRFYGENEPSQLRIAESDPDELADLVSGLTSDRPANLEGIIWYRLPVSTDRFNWPWPTLLAVMKGVHPKVSLNAYAEPMGDTLVDILVSNNGETSEPPPTVLVSWQDANLIASDGLYGFTITGIEPWVVEIKPPTDLDAARAGQFWPLRLFPGVNCPIGWLRFDNRTEVTVEIVPEAE